MLEVDRLEKEGRYDAFTNGEVLFGKKKNHLPALGWNSWNCFGSGNTQELSMKMADRLVELGLDKLGYKYIVLDDGCYKEERVDGRLSNETVKFPDGFKVLSDYIHGKGLKFGMYNDIGTNLCAGAAVGTCGHEDVDAASYIEWGVDFLKVDNCYYPFDDATFSDKENAKYTYGPAISKVLVKELSKTFEAGVNIASDTIIKTKDIDGKVFFFGIGTLDGTGPMVSPTGELSGEISFDINAPEDGEYTLAIDHVNGHEVDNGAWLEVATGFKGQDSEVFFDGFIGDPDSTKLQTTEIKLTLKKGSNHVRLMNHRRQENTLNSYARLLKELNKQKPDHDIIYSACEWGKTQPQSWGYKVCDSWRILNDISFRVGSDGHPGHCDWTGDYTTNIAVQYSKAVIMDEFAGLSKGWNDPDMLAIGMEGLNEVQNKTHMTMWCMMNSPLMLGIDLRTVEKGDAIYNIIANEDALSLNQDKLGIQAKRVYSSLAKEAPDKEYIQDINRVDILVKPLSEDRFAISFINVSLEDTDKTFKVDEELIKKFFGDKIKFFSQYKVKDIWSKEETIITDSVFAVNGLKACDNRTIIVTGIKES